MGVLGMMGVEGWGSEGGGGGKRGGTALAGPSMPHLRLLSTLQAGPQIFLLAACAHVSQFSLALVERLTCYLSKR